MIERPLDLLNNLNGKKIEVQRKDSKKTVGILIAFDIHINLVIESLEGKNIFIKGDNVLTVEGVK